MTGAVEFFLVRKKILPKVRTVEEAIREFQRMKNHDDGGIFLSPLRAAAILRETHVWVVK